MKKEKKVDSISTFLGADATVEGSITFQGTIRVDGRVKGKISSNGGTVIVGEKAVVNADLFVGVAVIMGEVNGTIEAKDRIEVYPPGRVGGDIKAPVISIEPGGVFNGNCAMVKKTGSPKQLAAPAKTSPAGRKPKDSENYLEL